jgi:hypothetical protein
MLLGIMGHYGRIHLGRKGDRGEEEKVLTWVPRFFVKFL